eukprot:CAMPEP_0177519116 /NCGR_PEP_ID=MMETSP0369-20130122/46910_1 /TAXON_ID=447022 ORGANISM="Scrippsiella hangoei-like, Strain SHHI-4" /NCGR_SAMPLE_ID=MMETSP0369 /ASSEMBLY_ACC=CAM_ASM_000364 /LENGTH=114 /DNA_ID=CAMNT_0018998315 /DNA_START=221 /DNA_END=565 /DNA_ORIENTATION=-
MGSNQASRVVVVCWPSQAAPHFAPPSPKDCAGVGALPRRPVAGAPAGVASAAGLAQLPPSTTRPLKAITAWSCLYLAGPVRESREDLSCSMSNLPAAQVKMPVAAGQQAAIRRH